MDLKNQRMKNTFMTNIYQDYSTLPIIALRQLKKKCILRLKLYRLLQQATHDCALYSTEWKMHLVKALAKEKLVDFFALLNTEKMSDLQAIAAQTKAAAQKTTDVCESNIEPVTNSDFIREQVESAKLVTPTKAEESVFRTKVDESVVQTTFDGSVSQTMFDDFILNFKAKPVITKSVKRAVEEDQTAGLSIKKMKCLPEGINTTETVTEIVKSVKSVAEEDNVLKPVAEDANVGKIVGKEVETAEPVAEKVKTAKTVVEVRAPILMTQTMRSADISVNDNKAAEHVDQDTAVESKQNKYIPDAFFKKYFEYDEVSHYALALTASRNQELKWLFINLETQWLLLKFYLNVPEESMLRFLWHNGIILERATNEEILSIQDELLFYDLEIDTTPIIIKLRLEEASNLLFKRKVIIKNGFMYFPGKAKFLGRVLNYTVGKQWKKKIDKLSEFWHEPSSYESLAELVTDFEKDMKSLLYFTGEDGASIFLTLKRIDEHSDKYFPLCMSELHRALKEKNHLKHFARKQYAIFLKNAGMAYDDYMQYFESEFTKKMSTEDFVKQRYSYYFAHFHGKVGARINYTVQNCEAIIVNDPTGNQEHGCPFAHAGEEALSNILEQHHIRQSAIEGIMEFKRSKQYRKACCLYFREKNHLAYLDSVTSPNTYYACAMAQKVVDIEDIFIDSD